VAKVRELRIRAHDDPALLTTPEGRDMLEHYQAALELLERRDGAAPLTRAPRFELEALGTLPPAGAPDHPARAHRLVS
jgi:hypothetical protein